MAEIEPSRDCVREHGDEIDCRVAAIDRQYIEIKESW